jgi:hypothetical protein
MLLIHALNIYVLISSLGFHRHSPAFTFMVEGRAPRKKTTDPTPVQAGEQSARFQHGVCTKKAREIALHLRGSGEGVSISATVQKVAWQGARFHRGLGSTSRMRKRKRKRERAPRGQCRSSGSAAPRAKANARGAGGPWGMAHRPRRTFRQRQADSSDSDGSKDQSAESPGPAEVAGRPHRARGPRGRARVWASSRRAPGAAPRVDGGSGAPGDAGTERSRGHQGTPQRRAARAHSTRPPAWVRCPLLLIRLVGDGDREVLVQLGGSSFFAPHMTLMNCSHRTIIDVYEEPKPSRRSYVLPNVIS